jgi:hypothetical protein
MLISEIFQNKLLCPSMAARKKEAVDENRIIQSRWTECIFLFVRGSFEKFVDWRQCAAVMQKEAVTVMPSYNGGDNVVVEKSSSL